VTIPSPQPADPTAIVGYSYSGLFVRADHDAVLDRLTEHRFTGWLGPQEGSWVLAVAEEAGGAVAAEGRTLVTLARDLAGQLATVLVVARVERDRMLRLDGFDGSADREPTVHGAPQTMLDDFGNIIEVPVDEPDEDDDGDGPSSLGSYVSDPTLDHPDDDAVFPEPSGAWHAERYAQACGRDEVAEELQELLAEHLDSESVLESERLDTVLRLLDLPRWLISAQSLPGDLPVGPRKAELVRLGAGRSGAGGLVMGAVTGALRKRRRPR
jgi:hypothetical protein